MGTPIVAANRAYARRCAVIAAIYFDPNRPAELTVDAISDLLEHDEGATGSSFGGALGLCRRGGVKSLTTI